jgi:hypothetical protein
MRFAGTIEYLCDVDLTKSHAEIAEEVISEFYPGCAVSGIGVWEMEPGLVHPDHWDDQPLYWLTRVHVPLVTNPSVVFTMEDGEHHMEVGKAYRMNTLSVHAVANKGETARTHLVFDIRSV